MLKKIVKTLIFFLPFILGTIGFHIIEGAPLNDALFFSIGFYTLNNTDPASNIFIELARWTAPLATASGLIMAVTALKQRLKDFFAYLGGESIAVYGSQEDISVILGQLGRRGIRIKDEERLPKAGRYILMGQEEENFKLYQKFENLLAGKQVYLRCRSMNGRASGASMNLFFEEEIAARIFWKKQSLYDEAGRKNFRLNIVFPEFGILEEQLLLWGLQNNIFHPKQKIAYHVFGESGKFQAIYHELSQMEDPVIFHAGQWYDSLGLLERADRIIVSDTKELLGDLLFAIPEKCIDVLAESREAVLHYESRERLRLFFWRQEAEKLSNILEAKTLDRAKSINLRYAHLYSGVEETKENKEEEWGKLNTFTKYSNISSADYHEVRLFMIEEWKQKTGKSEPDEAYLLKLAELEHIRWNRYHYLNNWKYGVPQNEKNKDTVKRVHKDLVPFTELTREEQEKDAENIRVLLSVTD